MKKFLMIFTSILTLALLLGEVFYPNFPLVWMASEGTYYAFIRASIVVVLTILFFSEVVGITVPRPLLIAGVGGMSAIVATLLISDTLSLADGVIFTETAIVLALEALEAPVRLIRTFNRRPIGKLGVGNDFVKIG